MGGHDVFWWLAEVWPKMLVFDAGRYLIAAPVMFAIVYLFLRPRHPGRRLQPRLTPKPQDYRREILASLRTVLVFSFTGLGIALGATAGLLKAYGEWDGQGWLWLFVSVPLLLVLHDTYFYWTHRLLHQRKVFRWTHLLHHRSRAPTPFAAYAFAVPEALVQTMFMPLMLLVLPFHGMVVFVFLAIMMIRNVIGHCGYEIHPRGMADHWLGQWFTTTTHHDMHHQEGRYNYGLYFTWWDRLMGTENPRYRQRYREVTQASPRLAALPAAAE